MRTATFYRQNPGVQEGRAEACTFEDVELAVRHIVRGADGLVTRCEALRVVNDWNRISAEWGGRWRYWV